MLRLDTTVIISSIGPITPNAVFNGLQQIGLSDSLAHRLTKTLVDDANNYCASKIELCLQKNGLFAHFFQSDNSYEESATTYPILTLAEQVKTDLTTKNVPNHIITSVVGQLPDNQETLSHLRCRVSRVAGSYQINIPDVGEFTYSANGDPITLKYNTKNLGNYFSSKHISNILSNNALSFDEETQVSYEIIRSSSYYEVAVKVNGVVRASYVGPISDLLENE